MQIREQIYSTTDKAWKVVEEQRVYLDRVLSDLSKASVQEIKTQVFEQTKRLEDDLLGLIGERVLKKIEEVRKSIDPMFSQAVQASEVTRDRLGLQDNETVNGYIGQIEKMKAALVKEAQRLEAYANERVSVKKTKVKKKATKKKTLTKTARSTAKKKTAKKVVAKKTTAKKTVSKKKTSVRKKAATRKKS